MRSLILLLLVFVATLAMAALCAYPVHLLLADSLNIRFHKLLTINMLGWGLVFSLLYLHLAGGVSRQALGFQSRRPMHAGVRGMLGGILVYMALEGGLLLLGIHEIDHGRRFGMLVVLTLICKGLIIGVLTGVIEETLFRGAIFAGLRYSCPLPVAILLTSAMYAAVHYIKVPELAAGKDLFWYSGFELLSRSFRWWTTRMIYDSLLTLFALGLILALLRWRQGHLFGCIGLHAGIVATQRISDYTTNYAGDTHFHYLVNYIDHTLGWLAAGWLLLVACAYYVFSGPRQTGDG